MNPFKFAIQGIIESVRTQLNMKIHLVATVAVITAGIFLKINTIEWIAVILCTGLVISVEMINTAIEYIVDFISPEQHEMAGKIKDIGAGAVLVICLTAAVTGLVIFLPKIIALIS